MKNNFFILTTLLSLTVRVSLAQSNQFDSKTDISKLLKYVQSNLNTFDPFDFVFDTIKSDIYSRIDTRKLTGVLHKKSGSNDLKYKVQKLSSSRFKLFFVSDSLKGCIQGVHIDSVYWFGIIDCYDKNTKSFKLTRECNYVIGQQESVLVFTSSNSGFSYRECESDPLLNNRLIVLNQYLEFENLFTLDMHVRNPKNAIFVDYSKKLKRKVVKIVPVMDSMFVFGDIYRNSLEGFFKKIYDYKTKWSYSKAFPLAVFDFDSRKKFPYRSSEKIFWIYDERFYLIPSTPWENEF